MANKLYKPILIDSIKAAVDLEKHRFVGFDGNYCEEGEKAFGVIDVETAANQYAPAAVTGILLIECAETIAVGDEIASDSEGKAVLWTSRALSNGFALDAGEEGDVIRIVRGI